MTRESTINHQPSSDLQPSSELDTLIPQPVTIEVAGKTLDILPIKVGKLPAFIRAVSPFLGVFKQDKNPDFLALLSEHGESVLDACAVGANVERAWIDGLDPAQLLQVAQAVVEVNMDFFTRSLAPAITAAAGGLSGKLAGVKSLPG